MPLWPFLHLCQLKWVVFETRRFIDYINTSLHFADERYAKLFRDSLEESGVISKGPYLDIGGSFRSGKSLKELSELGQASVLFGTLLVSQKIAKKLSGINI
jgi:hypothetical protein